MKSSIKLLVLYCFILTFSCKEKLKTDFDQLEITIETQPGQVTSVLVDSSQSIFVRMSKSNSNPIFYRSTLTAESITNLNHLVRDLYAQKFDSIEGGPSKYTIAYCVCLKKKGSSFCTLVYQDKDFDTPYKELYALVKYLTLLAKETTKFPVDSSCNFNTLKRMGRVKPIIKFSPPEILGSSNKYDHSATATNVSRVE
jgi:hypothetical protein